MEQKIMTHVVQPNGIIIEIHDHARGQPNGVATLNAQGALEQALESEYAIDFPSPNGVDSLAVWAYKQLTA